MQTQLVEGLIRDIWGHIEAFGVIQGLGFPKIRGTVYPRNFRLKSAEYKLPNVEA